MKALQPRINFKTHCDYEKENKTLKKIVFPVIVTLVIFFGWFLYYVHVNQMERLRRSQTVELHVR